MARKVTLVVEGSVVNNPELMRYWDTERNTVSPSTVLETTISYMHFRCPDNPEHRWMAKVCDMARDCKCPGCVAGTDRKMPQKRKVKKGNSLAEKYPDIAKEWYQPFNGTITPYDINRCSTNKYWFHCEQHDVNWETKPMLRVQKGSGCPVCKLQKLHDTNSKPPKGGSLGDLYQDLAKQWNKEKNGDITPFDIYPQSHTDFWWTCDYNPKHVWKTSPHNRINGGTGCPKCSKWQHTSFPEKAIFYYISQVFPDALESYNPEPETLGRMTFDIYIPSIRTALEYDGQAWHRDEKKDAQKDLRSFILNITVIRIREPDCPVYNQLLSTHYIFREHTTTFESLDECIREVFKEIGVTVDFDIDTKSDAPHIYKLLNMSRSNRSVADRYPEIAAEWNPEDNEGIELSAFRVSSNYRGIFTCSKGHKYSRSIRNRCAGYGCSICKRVKASPEESLEALYPKISAEWLYTTDGSALSPSDVKVNANLMVHWGCSAPGCTNEWDELVRNRTRGSDDPYCDMCKTGYQHLILLA